MSNTLLLIRGASDGDANAVTSLLGQGADVNGKNESGQTPLIRAVIAGEADMVRLLLSAGADVRLKDDFGLSAAEWSERRGFTELTQLITAASPAHTVTPPTKPDPDEDPPEVEIERRRLASEPRIAPDHDAQIWLEEQRLPDAWPTPHQAEETSRPSATEIGIAKEQNDRRWIESQKRIIAEANRREEEEARRQHPTEEAIAPEPDAPVWKEQQHRILAEHERREGEDPPQTAEQSARIKARMESNRISEEALKRVDEEVRAKTQRKTLGNGYSERRRPLTETATLEPGSPAGQPRWGSGRPKNAPSDSSNLKRCPKCNATYDSELLKYCARDATPLLSADDTSFSLPAAQASARPTVWILVAITLMGSALVTYLATNYFSNEVGFRAPLVAQVEQPVSAEKNLPLLDGDLNGKEISLPEPEYPAEAKNERIAGTVRVAIRVNKTGDVTSARVLSGHQRLRPAAVKAAKSATFSAEKLAGRGAGGTITYSFKL